MKRLGILVVGTVATLLLGAGPASAQKVYLQDPAGDAPEHSIDFTRVKLDNTDHNVVARLRLYNAESGALLVSVKPRHARGVRMVSLYDPVGHTSNYVADGAFGDPHPAEEPMRCRGYRVRWSPERPIVTLKMPSRCLNGGRYSTLQFSVLTEDNDGGDSDDAGPTGWVPRG